MGTVDKVRAFHKAFGHGYDKPLNLPEPSFEERVSLNIAANTLQGLAERLRTDAERIGDSPLLLRLRLLVEEVGELADSMDKNDLDGMADDLTDIQYVLDGAYLEFGADGIKEKLFNEVHRANMDKLGPDGKPMLSKSGKVMKPEGWTGPKIYEIVGAKLRADDNLANRGKYIAEYGRARSDAGLD